MLQTRVALQLVYLHTGDCSHHHSAIKVSVQLWHKFGYTVSPSLLLFLSSSVYVCVCVSVCVCTCVTSTAKILLLNSWNFRIAYSTVRVSFAGNALRSLCLCRTVSGVSMDSELDSEWYLWTVTGLYGHTAVSERCLWTVSGVCDCASS